jgi:MtN3 and saliva related transmembrane protein
MAIMPEIIGWGSALILLPAFGLETYRQWKNRHEPVNFSTLWFFVLVLIGTAGQVVYSWLVGNWVYLALNSALVINNSIGLAIAMVRWRAGESVDSRRLESSQKA